jgi:hypothetical protein
MIGVLYQITVIFVFWKNKGMLDEKWFQIIPISYINPIMQYIRALMTILNSMYNEKCILMMPISYITVIWSPMTK